MNAADAAKLKMIGDRAAGEKAFESLLKQYPRDGMIYFKRGEAYEALREKALAAADYQRAMALFPMPVWKESARKAWERVKP
jgi:tetratricopeptide (TPR) repeat protein